MSRLARVLIALLAIAAIASPALAEDRLALSGQMRVLFNHTDDGGDNTNSFFSQRLRIGGKFSIAEGVSVSFRTDVTESDWGSGNTFGSGRMTNDDNGNNQWDRAFIDLDFDSFSLRAGQQFVAFGLGSTVNAQSNGFKATLKGPVQTTLFWMLLDDDTNSADTVGSDSANDAYLYGANVAHNTDFYAANVFVAGQNGAETADEDSYVIGVNSIFNLDAVKLTAQAEYFTGDYDSDTDAYGLQGFFDAAFSASEALTFGGQIYYAQAADDDEKQYFYLGKGDFDGWDPLNTIGVGLDNIKEVLGRPYNLFRVSAANDDLADAGVIAARLYTTARITDTTNLGASFTYAEPEDDDRTTADSLMVWTAGCSYQLMANAKLAAQVSYEDFDQDDMDEVFKIHTGLFVNF